MSQDFFIDVPDRHHHFARMHRAKLQRALLEKIPSEMIHLNKKAENVEADRKRGGKVTFTDGTTIKADIIIGADGIKSVSAVSQRGRVGADEAEPESEASICARSYACMDW